MQHVASHHFAGRFFLGELGSIFFGGQQKLLFEGKTPCRILLIRNRLTSSMITAAIKSGGSSI
jgi:hypothetical protein